MNLSKREKILLTILGVLLFWYLVAHFVLMPMVNHSMDLNMEIGALEQEKSQMDLYLEKFGDLDEKLAAEQDIMVAESYFYRDIDEVFIDRLLQKLATDHHVTLVENIITPAVETALLPYDPTLPRLEYPIRVQKQLVEETTVSEAEAALAATAATVEAAATAAGGTTEPTQAVTDPMALPDQPDQGEVSAADDAAATTPTTEESAQLLPMYTATVVAVGRLDQVVAMLEELRSLDRSVVVSTVGSGAAENVIDGIFYDQITFDFYYLEGF